jgi:hypothetical protein
MGDLLKKVRKENKKMRKTTNFPRSIKMASTREISSLFKLRD